MTSIVGRGSGGIKSSGSIKLVKAKFLTLKHILNLLQRKGVKARGEIHNNRFIFRSKTTKDIKNEFFIRKSLSSSRKTLRDIFHLENVIINGETALFCRLQLKAKLKGSSTRLSSEKFFKSIPYLMGACATHNMTKHTFRNGIKKPTHERLVSAMPENIPMINLTWVIRIWTTNGVVNI
ncbi:hypothetical protein TorRG33x02_182410, partial [Trema orientale]